MGRPLWSRDGKELFFVPAPGQLHGRQREDGTKLHFHESGRMSLEDSGCPILPTPRTFDMPMPDGRIVGVGPPGQSQGGSGPAQIHVVLNWFEELKARAPTK